MSATEILTALCGVPLPDDVPFTVVEGWRIREIDAALAARGWIAAGEYAALAAQPSTFQTDLPLPGDSLEGYLFPETYLVIPEDFTPRGFIERQLGMLQDRFWTANAASFTAGASASATEDAPARGFAEVIIMASMLEREEPTRAQRPLVAGILWKRLDSGWNLGVDATSRYTLDQWNDRKAFLKKLRDPSDPYNTRLRGGLPPTAIGNPGLGSLQAALDATDSEFWYYLHDSDQVLRPSRSAAEHEAKRRQYSVW